MADYEFGEPEEDIISLGGTQPEEGPFKVKLTSAFKLVQEDGKEWIEYEWSVIEDPKNTGSIGKTRSERTYFPTAKQSEEKRKTTIRFLRRFLVIWGLPLSALKGRLGANNIVASLNVRAPLGTVVPIHYSPFVKGQRANSDTTWLKEVEYAAVVDGKLKLGRPLRPQGPGIGAEDLLGADIPDDTTTLNNAGAVDDLLGEKPSQPQGGATSAADVSALI